MLLRMMCDVSWLHQNKQAEDLKSEEVFQLVQITAEQLQSGVAGIVLKCTVFQCPAVYSCDACSHCGYWVIRLLPWHDLSNV